MNICHRFDERGSLLKRIVVMVQQPKLEHRFYCVWILAIAIAMSVGFCVQTAFSDVVAENLSPRQWTSLQGAVVSATLIEIKESTIVLRRDDGRQAEVPFDRLSQPDLVYLLKQRTRSAAPASTDTQIASVEDAKQNPSESIDALYRAVGRLNLEDYWRMESIDRDRVAVACARQLVSNPTELRATLDKYCIERDIDKRRQILIGVAVLSIDRDTAVTNAERSVARELTPHERQQFRNQMTEAIQKFVMLLR